MGMSSSVMDPVLYVVCVCVRVWQEVIMESLPAQTITSKCEKEQQKKDKEKIRPNNKPKW